MDPCSSSTSMRRCGFPRPRGDGPVEAAKRKAAVLVSPPTRGWTPPSQAGGLTLDGFPAHAGMDPPPVHRPLRTRRFPRPRGDGPARGSRTRVSSLVSPPTRGWTVLQLLPDGRVEGFPAHAGMDRWRAPDFSASVRFPRPRGDGPPVLLGIVDPDEVSPPTRGWTLQACHHTGWVTGFPAHAGMDPAATPACTGSCRFPRPRGDGPWIRCRCVFAVLVSPPTRGWTCQRRAIRRLV